MASAPMIRLGCPSGVAYLEETLLLSVILIHTYTLSTSLSLSRQRSFSASHHSSHRIVLCSAYYYIRRSLWSLSSFCRTVPCFSFFFYFPFTLFFARRWPFVCFYTSTLPHFYFYLSVRCSFCLIGCTNIRASFIHHRYSTIHRSIKSLWPLFELLQPFLPTYLPFQALLRLYYDTFTKLVLALQADTSSSSPHVLRFLHSTFVVPRRCTSVRNVSTPRLCIYLEIVIRWNLTHLVIRTYGRANAILTRPDWKTQYILWIAKRNWKRASSYSKRRKGISVPIARCRRK